MRIVIDLQACQNGSRHRGIGRYALAMTKALIQLGRGHDYRIVLSDAFPDTILDVRRALEGLLPQEHILVFSLPDRTSSTDPDNAWRTRAAEILRGHFITGLSPDLLFVPSLFEGYWDRTVVSIEPAPYPVAVTLYDLIPLEYPHQHLPGEHDRAGYLHKIANVRQADLLLAISDFVAGEATTRLGVTPDKVVSTPLGVDSWFRIPAAGTIDRAALMRRYGIERPFVLNASPLEFRKNIEGLVAGFASMRPDIRARYQLVIIGKMSVHGHRHVAALAAAEGLPEDAVVLAHFVPDEDLVALYNQCELFAFPSLSEGFGLPVLEAMACGAPVVGSTTTSIPEVIGRADLLFDPLDASAMGQAMERVLADPVLQAELRTYGPERAATFSWEKAAATALAAFERLQANRGPRPAVSSLVRSAEKRLRVALVASTMAPQHYLADRAIALATALAERHEVMVICPEGNVDDQWVRGAFETRDPTWLDTHAASFDHIVYSADPTADDRFIEMMAEHPGILVLHERPCRPPAALTIDGRLPLERQRALFAARGYAGLIDALASDAPPEHVRTVPGEWLREHATVTLEGSSQAGEGLLMPPLARSAAAAAMFRARHDIPAGVTLVAAFAADEADAALLVRAFRSSRTALEANGYLALYVDVERPRSATDQAGRMFGNVFRLDMLDTAYRGLASAADISVLAADLPISFRTMITQDAAQCGQAPACIATGSSTDLLIAAIDAAHAIAIRNSARSTDPVQLPAALKTEAMNRLEAALNAPRSGATVDRHALIAALPAVVRAARPDSADLAAFAVAIARNEAHHRTPVTYCDISAFAAPGPTRRLDPLSREFLRMVLHRGGKRIRAVYGNGTQFIEANYYVHKLLGLDTANVSDRLIDIRPGDRVIGFDILASFQSPVVPALRNAVEQGGAIGYVVARLVAQDRGDLLAEISDLALAWADAKPVSAHSHITPPDAVAMRAAGSEPGPAAATIERLIAAAIPVGILAVDEQPLRLANTGDPESALAPAPLPEAARAAGDRLESARAQPVQSRPGFPADPGYVITGHLLGSYSLAIVNRNFARTLERAHPGKVRYLPVETVPIDHTEGVPAAEKAQMIELSARPAAADGNEIVISHHYPVLLLEDDYRLCLALFFWEESHVPAKTIRLLAKGFDGIISPTRTVTHALIDSGLNIPVATIGQPVDLAPYTALAASRPARGGVTTFLHVSSCFKRKGVDVLLAAWARAFTAADNVRLVIKTFPNPHNDVEQQVTALRSDNPRLAAIEIVNRDAAAEEMPDFYAAADVMVLPSRGEGYNLPALEAMAAGLPLIVTGHGGHRDFCGPGEARMIAYRFAPSESHVGGRHSMWVEPDIDDLAHALREQIDPTQASAIEARRQQAIVAATEKSDQDAWLRRQAAMVSDLLTKSGGGPPRIAWVTTWDVQCGIAQYSSYLLGGMSEAARARTIVLCDERTMPRRGAAMAHDPVWVIGQVPKADVLAEAVERHGVEAVVIQHQDGLISWNEIGRIGAHPRLAEKVTIVVLHNARNLHRVGADELPVILAGLARMDRVLVHNISDVNFLLGLGLSHNVALLPHGALASPVAPWPRVLDRDDDPVIGCHGFFFRHKGIDKLIRAAAILRREWPGLRLRLVNARFPGGEHDAIIAECQQLAAELGIVDAIEWHFDFLPVAQIHALLAGCDLLVLPYDESDDSASGAVRVSLSSMVPFVATRVKIFAELGDAVVWAESNDPDVLAGTIAPLLRSPAKRRAVQAGMHEWLAAHDWQRVAGTLEGMIEGLVRRKRLGWNE
jgi:glycosyltransferase involved in cell wall biosynthesis